MRLLSFVAAVFLASPALAQAPVWGIGKAKDGDSLMGDDTEVRLFGVDAPEFDQRCMKNGESWGCGAAASDQL